MDLTGKVALVTGGGSGVGLAIAGALARSGARVGLVGRDRQRLARGADALPSGACIVLQADLRDPTQSAAAIAELRAQAGDPTIVVNAAGAFGPIARLEDTEPASWIDTIATNLIAPYLVAHGTIAGMRRARWGRIINVGSAASLHPPGPLTSAYATSKAALDRFTRQLAAELGPHGITANVIHPGEVNTAMWQDIRTRAEACGAEGEGLRAWAALVDQTGGDSPERAAELALRIVADPTINGRFMWIDGGLQRPLPSWDGAPPAPVFADAATVATAAQQGARA